MNQRKRNINSVLHVGRYHVSAVSKNRHDHAKFRILVPLVARTIYRGNIARKMRKMAAAANVAVRTIFHVSFQYSDGLTIVIMLHLGGSRAKHHFQGMYSILQLQSASTGYI